MGMLAASKRKTAHRDGRSGGQKLDRLTATAVLAGAGLLTTGCRQDMHNQPKFFPQRGTDFYPDGRSARPQVENTVARGQLSREALSSTRDKNGRNLDAMPFPVTMAVLERGQERYNIYCSPCHSRVGNGAGMIVQRGYARAGNFEEARLVEAPLGHFFVVMTNGFNAMPDYAAQLTPEDRWAVAAYIRALQLSQNASRADVPEGVQIRPLSAIAEGAGLPPNFGYDWGLPPTAVGENASGGGSFHMDLPVSLRRSLQGVNGQASGAHGMPGNAGAAPQPGSAGQNATSGPRNRAPMQNPGGVQK